MSKKKIAALDERQIQVRRRVFEKSYATSFGLISIALGIVFVQQSLIIHLNSPLIAFDLLALFSLLPSMYAVWEKDS